MPWAEKIRRQIRMLSHSHPSEFIGVAAPGLAARDGRSIAWMEGRLAEVKGLDWTTFLNWPRPIPVMNDAHAAMLGEMWQGAAKGVQNAVLLTLGTGVGGAIVCDGKLLQGHLGRAGHLGHITLNPDGPPDLVGTPGSLEDAVGEATLSARSKGSYTTTQQLIEAVRAGDTQASAIWQRCIRDLAAGIVSIVNVVDPDVVIIGGGIAAAGDDLFVPLRKHLDRWEWRPNGAAVRVVPATLGDQAGAIGAAYKALA
jgi:glucokinase